MVLLSLWLLRLLVLLVLALLTVQVLQVLLVLRKVPFVLLYCVSTVFLLLSSVSPVGVDRHRLSFPFPILFIICQRERGTEGTCEREGGEGGSPSEPIPHRTDSVGGRAGRQAVRGSYIFLLTCSERTPVLETVSLGLEWLCDLFVSCLRGARKIRSTSTTEVLP